MAVPVGWLLKRRLRRVVDRVLDASFVVWKGVSGVAARAILSEGKLNLLMVFL